MYVYNSNHHAKLIIHAVESLGQQITAPWSTLLLALLFYDTDLQSVDWLQMYQCFPKKKTKNDNYNVYY